MLSAGSEPGDQLNPAVVEILIERCLDATKEFPKPITDESARAADGIVTMAGIEGRQVNRLDCQLDTDRPQRRDHDVHDGQKRVVRHHQPERGARAVSGPGQPRPQPSSLSRN